MWSKVFPLSVLRCTYALPMESAALLSTIKYDNRRKQQQQQQRKDESRRIRQGKTQMHDGKFLLCHALAPLAWRMKIWSDKNIHFVRTNAMHKNSSRIPLSIKSPPKLYRQNLQSQLEVDHRQLAISSFNLMKNTLEPTGINLSTPSIAFAAADGVRFRRTNCADL